MVNFECKSGKKSNAEAKYFYRYTNLAAAIYLLKTKKLTLLSPIKWDDKNDVFFMKTYKKRKSAKTILSLCFVEGAETYHHWKVFANGPNGVSINFEKNKLLSIFDKDNNIEHGPVKYMSVQQMENSQQKISKLPFLKRYPYRGEEEYRVIYVDTEKLYRSKGYDIDLRWIKWIRLSPWMPKPLVRSVKETLKSISGCTDLKILQSTVTNNKRWKDVVN